MSTIAVEPGGTGYMVAGGDVSGLHVSENLGERWYSRNINANTSKLMHIAGVKYSATVPGKVFACIGSQGSGGGVFVSTDYGKTWSTQSTTPQFSGGNNTSFNPPLPKPHPRSTGNLLELDEANGYMYAATFNGGVMRWDSGSGTWSAIGLTGGTNYGRGIALDPASLTTLYVSVYQAASASVYKVTNSRAGSPTVTLLANSPAAVENLIVINGVVYAAAAGGIYSLSTGAGDVAWTQLDATANWKTITGFFSGGNTTLYAGRTAALAVGSNYSCLKKSTDGGATWTELTTDPTKIHYTAFGRTSTWWLSVSNPYGMLGNKRYVASHIAINPSNTNQIFVAGRSGVWRSDNAGVDWYPAIRNALLTINKSVRVDPNDPNNIYMADTDWVSVRSTDGMQTVVSEFPYNVSSDAFDFAFDTSQTPSRAYIAIGDTTTSNSGGKILSRVPSSSRWVSEQFELAGASVGAEDNFSRTVSSGWGSADTGGAYTTSGGVNADYNVTTAGGTMGPIANATVRNAMLNGVSLADATGQVTLVFDTAPAGANNEARVVLRGTPTLDQYYSFGIRQQSSGAALNLIIRKQTTSAQTVVANIDIYATYTLGTPIVLQFSCVGSSLQASAWVIGDDPPATWQLNTTDTAVTAAGAVGIQTLRQSASTATPTTLYYNLLVLSPTAGGAAGAWPIGLACGKDASNNTVLLAATQKSGMWRKTVPSPGGGVWSLVNSSMLQANQATNLAPMSWVTGSANVYCFDRPTGVWQSKDYGTTWAKIWNISTTDVYTGFIAADVNDPSVLWVSYDAGLYKVTGVDTGTSVGSGMTATLVAAVANPGPLKSVTGRIYVATKIGVGVPTNVLYSSDSGTTWNSLSTEMMPNSAPYIYALDVDSNGRVYVSNNGNAVSYYVPRDTQKQQTV